MIDTVRIFAKIDKSTYVKIKSCSVLKFSMSTETGEIFYDISSDNLKGSYDSSLFVRVDTGEKYRIR